MTKRIVATNELLRMSVIGIQFVAGVRFLAGLFDSDETVRILWKSVSKTFDLTHVILSAATDTTGPPEALLLALGFMGFGYILFAVVPGTVAKMEKGKGFFFEN